jgi:hypothetical protein
MLLHIHFTSRLCTLLCLVFCLVGCSPQFDWRDARIEEHGVRALLPGKPATLERNINLAGLALKMTMVGARVDELTFTLAAAQLPEGTTATAAHLEAMQQQMLRNIGARSAAATPVQIGLVDAAGKSVGQIAASQIKVNGKVGERAVTMRAIFCRSGQHVIQAVMLGSQWDENASQQFFDSIKIEQRT